MGVFLYSLPVSTASIFSRRLNYEAVRELEAMRVHVTTEEDIAVVSIAWAVYGRSVRISFRPRAIRERYARAHPRKAARKSSLPRVIAARAIFRRGAVTARKSVAYKHPSELNLFAKSLREALRFAPPLSRAEP